MVWPKEYLHGRKIIILSTDLIIPNTLLIILSYNIPRHIINDKNISFSKCQMMKHFFLNMCNSSISISCIRLTAHETEKKCHVKQIFMCEPQTLNVGFFPWSPRLVKRLRHMCTIYQEWHITRTHHTLIQIRIVIPRTCLCTAA